MVRTVCGWCATFSRVSRVTTVFEMETIAGGVVTAAFTCDNCERVLLMSYYSNEPIRGDSDFWLAEREDELTWLPPTGGAVEYEDVPQHIAAAATEAHYCASFGAHRAAVQMARSVVEASAKEKGITKGRLVDKIDKMFERALIREHVKEAAHEVRHLGNEMAHGDFVEPVTVEESTEVLGLMSEVLVEVFQSPARVARRKAARLAKQQGDESAPTT